MDNKPFDKPITMEMMDLYVKILEKQVAQMSTVVITIEDVNNKLNALNSHFSNGFKDDIVDNIEEMKDIIVAQIERVSTVAAALAVANDKSSIALAALADKNTVITLNQLDKSMSNVQSSLKVYAVTNAVGWSALIATIVLKLLGRM